MNDAIVTREAATDEQGDRVTTIEGNRQTIVVAATFTAEMVEQPLIFWMNTLEIPADVVLAPYAQVMQELLDPESSFARTQRGFNIVMIRIQDWMRDRMHEAYERNVEHLRQTANDFTATLSAFQTRTKVSTFIFFCPPSSTLPEMYAQSVDEIQRDLIARTGALENIHCWSHADILRLYPAVHHEDLRADRVAHIPYTHEYFVAIATVSARRIAAIVKPPYKVLAIDADNTLWKGVCGEDGATGVELTPAHLELQRMLVRQHDAGMLLCVCSKNNPADLEEVFRIRADMPLKWKHVVCARVNWNPKSANLESLAQELDLSLDSFVLIDDSPVECAEVRAQCPAVLTLQFPDTQEDIVRFLDHVWAFDRVGVTQEAKLRTAQYKQNQARARALEEAGTGLKQFLASLELKVDVQQMQPEHLPRVAELVQRTNQFNLTGIRRRAAEIESLCDSGALSCLVVHVRDRFGDYGLVGAILLRTEASLIDVDTFVLSCRALGRGVEHRIVNYLGRMARESGRSRLRIEYRKSARNAPAWNFLEKSFSAFREQDVDSAADERSVFKVPIAYAEALGGEVESQARSEQRDLPQSSQTSIKSGVKWHEAAYRLSRLEDIVHEMNGAESRLRPTPDRYMAPRTPMEAAVARTWEKVLGLRDIGAQDDFFELGGDSVLAVQVIANIGSTLNLELSIYDFFDAPTVEEVARKLANASSADEPIEPESRIEPAPLSFAQQRLWFIDRLEGGSTAYHVPFGLRLRGRLDRTALQTALDALIARHEVLRTMFIVVDGEPVQKIAPIGSFVLQLLDLTNKVPQGCEAEVIRQSHEEAITAFDLSRGPLIRGKLLQLGDEEYVLLITMHHMVSDGWSLGVLFRELGVLYQSSCGRDTESLPPLPIQYADYARWQRQWLLGPQLQEQLAHWTEHLRGAPDSLELPMDRPRPANQSYRGANTRVSLGADLSADLRAFSRRLNLTLAMTIYTAWSVVLAKLSGQQDIVIGMPVANRGRTEIEGLIGFFVNTLAVRICMADDPEIGDLLSRAKEALLTGYENQDIPFEKVVEAIQPARSLSRSPIFQVMFVLHNAPRAVLHLPGLTLTEEDLPSYTAQFDLTLALHESENGIFGTLNYATDLFDAATVERWGGYFESVLRKMIADPRQRLSRLTLMSDAERRQVTEVFNATQRAFEHEQLIHELIEEQVERTPEAMALEYAAESLTYAALNAKANQLARYLRHKGVGPDRLVGICVERSLEMVIGLLGILKAGGAYVPLDPTYPLERLAYMLEDASPQVLLVQERLREKVPKGAAEVISLDRDWSEIAREDASNLGSRMLGQHSRHLVYVIYTSGSTGKPKGAMNEHQAVINRLQWMQHQYQLSDRDRVLQKTPFSFDVSVWEFFWPLMYGARLIVARPYGHQDPEYLRELIEQKSVTTLHFVPSMLQIFVDQLQPGQCPSLRHVVCSGEELSVRLQRKFFDCLPHVQLSNLYGPTEAAVDVTFWECNAQERSVRVPIGRPIWNTQIYVVDRDGEPAPIGVAGEIYIGGVGVGRGYLNRPELTNERFVRDPFSLDSNARVYRTGDLARWRADGAIEYLGRNDFQVKIRGVRIELGEIEVELARHAQVKEAVVLARTDVADDQRLVAYVVPRDTAAAPTVESLRTHLQEVLAEHMVPSAFVLLARMPLLPNGKLDRRALPAPESGAYVSREYEAPQGDLEEIVARIWRRLLRVERVGRHDNFFELGGHSLLIVQMMEQLRRVGLSTELRSIFEKPKLAELASSLARAAVDQYDVPPNLIPAECQVITPEMLPLVELTTSHIERIAQSVPGGCANVQDIYPLTPLQEGMLFHHLLNELAGDTYVLQILLSVVSRDRLEQLFAALQAAVNRHDILRTAVLWKELPRAVQVVYRRASLKMTEIKRDPLREPAEQAEEWMNQARQRLDLQQAPLMHVQVAPDSNNGQWYALLQFHHLVVDHVTLERVTSEIVAELQGHTERLPEPMPYRAHVAQALAYSSTAEMEEFFRRKLADVDESTAPFGLTDVHGDGSQIDEACEPLDVSLARRVRTQARRFGVSAATLFHAAWALVVARTSGRDDVVFGTLLLGRLQGTAGGSPIPGVFINTLPVRVKLDGLTSLGLVEYVQRELVELLQHEQASLAVAQKCSSVPGTAPLFTALLNYRHSVSNLETQWAGADGIRMVALQERTNYPIALNVDDFGEEFAVTAQTDRRIDPHRVVAYLQTATQSLVEALDKAPETPALALVTIPPHERHLLIAKFNATQAPYPREKLIHQLFEEQVERTPHEVAVLCADQHLTYGQLNRRANRLARYLRQRGAGAERFVGLCVERGIDMVVSVLAVLKAGSAYVPLDPNYPQHRLEYMLSDTAPAVVLTQSKLRERLPTAGTVIELDSQSSDIARQAAENLHEEVAVNSGNLAYLIYTSGSTGRPKGVAIEHRSAVNLIWWAQCAMPTEVFQETLHSTSLNFDLSVYEFFVPLATGGTLRVVQNALALINERGGVTLVNTVPSAIKSILDAGKLPATTRVVNLAGEALRKELVDLIFASSAVECVCNLYGPSETTTYSTWTSMPRDLGFSDTIGRPISNTQVYILDARGQLVPVGVAGEIYIAGAGVARGYLNRPELTAERFLPDPVSGKPQMRMYKTGDVGRWRADGSIEYLGRGDHQVKIRGFRIELGEIEAQLVHLPALREVVVLAREDVPGEERLVAYVVAHDAVLPPTVQSMRAHVGSVLPDHMVPSAFVVLDRMPLTQNGKVDRRALPAPELDAYVNREYEPPRGEVEEILGGIWQRLLRVERIGRQDNFFELGGHSLLIVQMMEQLRQLGLSTELRRVFDSPTLADLASALETDAIEHFEVPPNLIAPGCKAITPQMLTLVDLEPLHIETIVQSVPGLVANVQDIYPLAPLQEGILFHHLFDESRGDTYVLATLLAVPTRERLLQLIAALQAVIDRHDVLRTAVLWEELPRPVQVVYRHAGLHVEELELLGDCDPLAQLRELLRPEHQHVDIRRAPAMRLRTAMDPSTGQCYALLQTHHITFDHVTSEIVIAEAVAYLEGRGQSLPQPMLYREHVAQSLAYASKHDAEAFFRSKLGDIDEPTAPFGLLDVRGDGTHVREARTDLEPELARRIRARARRLGVSAATLFHAAWALVVAHTSGRSDVVFGTVLLGRLQGHAGAQRILGMFINTLPLRLQLEGVAAETLVRQTQRELVQLLAHEQASLAVAQRCSGVAATAPLFTALFNYRHSVASSEAQWHKAAGVTVLGVQERTNYPITLSVDDFGDEFALSALTDQRIDPHRLTEYLRTAIESLLDALHHTPDVQSLSLPIIPISELQLVAQFNATDAAYPRDCLVHELFEKQAERTPHAIAVMHEDAVLTYAELNERANRVARHLRRTGVRPDETVGICVERGTDMVVGVLAILKSGGAYVPLDPSFPTERLQYILDDAAPAVLLTQERLRNVLPNAAKVVVLDSESFNVSLEPAENIHAREIGLTPSNLVYVIYTSGSTGRPKGTAMPHRAMVNLIHWHRSVFEVSAGVRTLQFAALSFDVAFQETFSTLCTGGTLVMLSEAVRRDAAALMGLLRDSRIDRLFLPPLMLQSLAEHYRASGAASSDLKDVITAGEQLRITPEIVDLFRRLSGCRLHNHYGPTETHVVTAVTLQGDPQHWPALPPIGQPIANTQIYILDAHRQPVPMGVAGEIYVAGANLAREYRNRVDLTAERFLRDPFSADPQSRIYKTGDLGLWNSDGHIEYLGRNDDQVKIRGFRVEVGEIEAQLVLHPKVREAAVTAREDVPGEKRLVAYVIQREGDSLAVEELRAHLKSVLPAYMVPSAFVTLERLPLTPSGKLNRRALPTPELQAYASVQYEPPEGTTEQALAQIWQQVLGIERVGRQDDFFELGGHSLLALKALLRINQTFGCMLRVTDIYKSPTLQALAERVCGATLADDLIDLSREAVLDSTIVMHPASRRGRAEAILLTGGTGFVGRFLLWQLLKDTDAKLYCLVRADSQRQAAARLKATLIQWNLWQAEFEPRIVALAGDLRAPRLGLDARTYGVVSEQLDAIYHCGTSMNHLETYAMAKTANVDAANEVLKLATTNRGKVVNYISTLGIFSSSANDPPRVVDEETPIDFEKHSSSQGYIASKWVAEKMFLLADTRGVPCNIFRLGLVWADSERGRFDEAQSVYRVLKSSLLSGYGIRDYRYPMPPTPVDYVARSIVHLAESHTAGHGIFHISSSTQPPGGVFERCRDLLDIKIELLPYYRWICEIKRLHLLGRSLPAVPLIEYAFSMDELAFHKYHGDLRWVANVSFDCARTYRELDEVGIIAPVLNDEVLAACFADMLARDGDLRELTNEWRPAGHCARVGTRRTH